MAGIITPAQLRQQIISNAPHVEESTGSFSTDIHGKLKSCEISVTPSQDLHGQSKPWPAGTSVNQLKPNTNVPVTINGVTITYEEDGRFHFNGTATDKITFDLDDYVNTPVPIPHEEGQLELDFSASVLNQPTGVNYFSAYYRKNGGFYQGQSVWFTMTVGMIILDLTPEDEITVSCRIEIPKNKKCNDFAIGVKMTIGDNTAPGWIPYENRCSVAGCNSMTLQNDTVYGGNIEWNQLCDFSENGKWVDSFSAITHSWDNGVMTVHAEGMVSSHGCYFYTTEKANHKYYYYVRGKSVVGGEFPFKGTFELEKSGTRIEHVLPFDEEAEFFGTYTAEYAHGVYVIFSPGQDDYLVMSCCMLIDLTQMFGEGKEPTAEQFRAMFPHDYYVYNPGTITTADQVNGGTAKTWTVQFDDILYGGKFNFVTGDFTATWKAITLGTGWVRQGGAYSNIGLFYNSQMYDDCKVNFDAMLPTYPFDKNTGIGSLENYSATSLGGMSRSLWIRNDDYEDAADFEASIAGDKLVYELNTPVVIHLTPQQMAALKGPNNFFSDVGNMTIKYWTH